MQTVNLQNSVPLCKLGIFYTWVWLECCITTQLIMSAAYCPNEICTAAGRLAVHLSALSVHITCIMKCFSVLLKFSACCPVRTTSCQCVSYIQQWHIDHDLWWLVKQYMTYNFTSHCITHTQPTFQRKPPPLACHTFPIVDNHRAVVPGIFNIIKHKYKAGYRT